MKKILVITYDFPYPTTSGGKSRIYNLLKFSKRKDIEFYLFSFIRPNFNPKYKTNLEDIGVSEIYTHYRKKVKDVGIVFKTAVGSGSVFKNLYFEKTVDEKIINIVKDKHIDTILFESFYTSYYISEKLKSLDVTQIFGTENIEHELYFDFANNKPAVLKKLFLKQVEKIRVEEEAAYSSADSVLAVTQTDKSIIEANTKSNVYVIPNGIDSSQFVFKKKSNHSRNLLFVGNFSYFPNIDAMNFFYKNVFTKLENVSLTVVGKGQDKLNYLIQDSRVKNIEYVDDIRDVYYAADVFVFPVRYGGGTNFKILEAASCGTPIVAFPDRVKGLGLEENREYLGAKQADEFIHQIQTILDNPKTGFEIAERARKHIEKEFTWEKIGERLYNVLST